jgi:hypothetical protein
MRLLFVAMASFAAISSASAQGTISVTRPAGVGFSVTTGIGSSATLTTHPPALPPAFTNRGGIVGLFPYVPEPTERKKDDNTSYDRAAPKAPAPTPSPYQAANSIGRDRIESPHDAAFSKDNYFRQQEEKASAGR